MLWKLIFNYLCARKQALTTMSDGNFNRALLPHTPYASGLKAGRAMAFAKAEQAFKQWLQHELPLLDKDELAQKIASFRQLLR